MIDRTARNAMIEAIRGYRDEQMAAFEFDDRLSRAYYRTKDKTVRIIAEELWDYYDDLKDHKIFASKREWDYFHRLLLVLETDGELEHVGDWRWTIRQTIATLCLTGFACLALSVGKNEVLGPALLLLGFVSIGLAWWRRGELAKAATVGLPLTPFSSIGELRRVRRSIRRFVKKRYPSSLKGRHVRSPVRQMLLLAPYYLLLAPFCLLWLCFSPIVILFQAIPEYRSTLKIRLPAQAA